MAQCVIVGDGGVITATSDTPDACSGFLLVTPTEFAALQSIWQPLSVADGIVLGMAVLLVWASAFGFRLLGRMISQS